MGACSRPVTASATRPVIPGWSRATNADERLAASASGRRPQILKSTRPLASRPAVKGTTPTGRYLRCLTFCRWYSRRCASARSAPSKLPASALQAASSSALRVTAGGATPRPRSCPRPEPVTGVGGPTGTYVNSPAAGSFNRVRGGSLTTSRPAPKRQPDVEGTRHLDVVRSGRLGTRPPTRSLPYRGAERSIEPERRSRG